MGMEVKEFSFLEFGKMFNKEQYCQYIFAYKNLNDLIYNNMTFNLWFDNIELKYNPNRIFLRSGNGNFINNIIFERIKKVTIEYGDVFDSLHFLCGNVIDNSYDFTYTILAKKN